MRVLMASKAFVVGAYQQKLERIAAHPEVEHLTVVVPPAWQEPGGRLIAVERGYVQGYALRVEPIRFNGNFHLFHWPTLGRVMREVRPDVVHVDEEPYNLATALATWQARRLGARPLFFTWQNLLRRYPPPFRQLEQYVLRTSVHVMVGNDEAETVLRAKGYAGPVAYVPQVGVDPDVFRPRDDALTEESTFHVGFAGRLVEEKGLLVLLRALRDLGGAWRLTLIGSGPLETEIRRSVEEWQLGDRVTLIASLPSLEVAAHMRTFHAVVMPSLTRPNWKEQFGRLLVEAMASGVPVIGSSSGEIPHVVGDAGCIVPEGDATALRDALARLRDQPTLREELGARGRQRVLQRFTHQRLAQQTVEVYREALRAR